MANAYMFVHTKDGYVVVQIKDVTYEGLTSLNFSIIKFYDILFIQVYPLKQGLWRIYEDMR